MSDWISTLLLLAEDAPQKPPQAEGWTMFVPLVAVAVLFYFMLIRPQRREQNSRQAMLQALKKNDRVVTIGGIIGTVVNISDGDEITLRVDDNTRLRFMRSAIQRVLTAENEGDKGTASLS
jgi:preprotein translocase subunit YajC